jgi:CRP-like cAMP-binding protein
MGPIQTESYSKGDLIITEGEKGEKAFLINKGHVEIKKSSLDGQLVVLARLSQGQMFGEMCLFDNKPRSASAYALSDVELSVITKSEFLQYLENTPPQIKVIIELLLNRLRQTSSLVALLKMETAVSEKNGEKIKDTLKDIDFPV